MAHATIRATNIPEIVKLICEDMNLTEKEALDAFYRSATGKCYADDETGLYGQSALYVYGLFAEEVAQGSVAGEEMIGYTEKQQKNKHPNKTRGEKE